MGFIKARGSNFYYEEHGRGRPRAQPAAGGPNAVKGAPNGRCASAVAAEAATL